ncbi:MAG: hypothetical protein PVI97_00335 [Candidatus Thiodiazotropha sp.]|jgi:hypothetical protein
METIDHYFDTLTNEDLVVLGRLKRWTASVQHTDFLVDNLRTLVLVTRKIRTGVSIAKQVGYSDEVILSGHGYED